MIFHLKMADFKSHNVRKAKFAKLHEPTFSILSFPDSTLILLTVSSKA